MTSQVCIVKPDVFMANELGSSLRDQLQKCGTRISESREILYPLPRNVDNYNVYVDKNRIKFTLLLRPEAVYRPRGFYHLTFIFIIYLFIYLLVYVFIFWLWKEAVMASC